MRFINVIFLIGLFWFPTSYSASSNVKKLRFTAMFTFASSSAQLGREFKKSIDAAVTYANSQADFLPGYQLEVEYSDSGPVGNRAITNFYSWMNSFNEEHENASMLPIVLGTLAANGCFSLGLSLHYMNAIAAPYNCPVLELTPGFPRTDFPNIHRYMPGALDSIAAQIAFVKDIGHWNKVALVTISIYASAWQQAYREYAFLQAENISVVHFAVVQSFDDDSMLQIKDSNARIIILSSSFGVDANVLQFLCTSHKVGMTGPNFVFLITLTDEVDIWTEANLYRGNHSCSKEVVLEQLKISYWFPYDGQRVGLTPPNVTSLAVFDSAISTLAVLQSAERQLQASEFNLSLSDYSLRPDIVSKAINSSLYNYRVDYSTLGGDYQLSFWPETDRLLSEFHHVTKRIGGADGFDLTVATFDNPYRQVDWFNYSSKLCNISTNLSIESIFFYGKIPRDYPGNFTVHNEVSVGVFGSVIALAILITGLAVGLFGFDLKNSSLFVVKVTVALGCILLNVSAALFSARVSLAVCYLERICGVIGFSCITGPLAGAVLAFRTRSLESSDVRRMSSMSAMSMSLSQKLFYKRRFLQHTIFAWSIVSGIASIIMIGFFTADPIVVSNQSGVTVLDANIDAFVTTTTLICSSVYGQYRDYIFVAFQALCLVLSSLVAYRGHNNLITKVAAEQFSLTERQIKAVRFALWNLTGLTVAGLLIISILGAASRDDGSIVQRIAMSYFLIIGSACTISAILLAPLLMLTKANITPSNSDMP